MKYIFHDKLELRTIIAATIIVVAILLVFTGYFRMTSTLPKGATGEVSEWYGDILYTVKVTTPCASLTSLDESCVYTYYHFLGRGEDNQVLVDVTDEFPTEYYLNSNVGRYLLTLEEGV